MYCGTISHKTSEKCPVSKAYVAGQIIGQNGGETGQNWSNKSNTGLAKSGDEIPQ